MKARINFSLSSYTTDIDLEEYGYDEYTKWEDLTEDDKAEVYTSLQEQGDPVICYEGKSIEDYE